MTDDHILDKDRATLNEARLAHEFNLGGQRMSWLVTSQAFLFAAWVQVARLNSPSPATPTSAAAVPSPDLEHLTFLVPIVGLLVAVIGWVAVLAAQRVTDHLVAERVKYDRTLQLHAMGLKREDGWTRLAGHLPGAVLPPVFGIAWATALLRHHTALLDLHIWATAATLLFSALCIWLWRRSLLLARIGRRIKKEMAVSPKATDQTA